MTTPDNAISLSCCFLKARHPVIQDLGELTARGFARRRSGLICSYDSHQQSSFTQFIDINIGRRDADCAGR